MPATRLATSRGVSPGVAASMIRSSEVSWSEYAIVQCDELSQQLLGRVQFDRQSPFGEINLYMLRARIQAAADIGHGFSHQVVQACFPVIAFYASFGIYQA